MTITYDDIEVELNENAMQYLNPVDVSEGTRAYLAKLDRRDALGICKFGESLSDAIAFEHAVKDSDEVIARSSAMLTEIVAWLDRQGIDGRELLARRKLTPAFERQLDIIKHDYSV